MRISYDAQADALYIQLREATADDSRDLEEGVTADLDGDGHIIGLEVLDARERLGYKGRVRIDVEGLALGRVVTDPAGMDTAGIDRAGAGHR